MRFTTTPVFGVVKPYIDYRLEDGKIVAWAGAIHYDCLGNEQFRMFETKISSLSKSDGSAFTQAEFREFTGNG